MSSTDTHKKTVGMIGLGHVGLTLGLTLAEVGFTVRGIDKNKNVTDTLLAGDTHIHEVGLDELLAKHLGKNFTIVSDFEEENRCDIYIITVGTPLNKKLEPDYGFINSAADDLAKVIKKGDLIILRSTVPLGTSREKFLPRLLSKSSLAEDEVLIAFAPERTIEGNALHELRSLPQVVGGLNKESTEEAQDFFSTLTSDVVIVNSLEEAEIVKLINNAYRETVFSFANEVSLVAREWGIDTKRVIQAANHGYARSNIPLPSPGVGGYCLTKDGYLLATSAQAKNVPLHIIPKTRQVSAEMLHSLANEIHSFLKEHHARNSNPKIALLGFAFKGHPATSDMRGSMTPVLIKRLQVLLKDPTFIGYDPLVSVEQVQSTGVQAVGSVDEAIVDSDVVVIMNNHSAFKALPSEMFSRRDQKRLVYDTWGLLNLDDFTQDHSIIYKTL